MRIAWDSIGQDDWAGLTAGAAMPQVWAYGQALWRWPARGAIAAGMLFLIHGQGASYHLGWADPAARAGFAHGPMLWQAALELRARGVRWIDLGAVDAANPGLARFKLGTGAALRALGPTCWVLP